MQPPFYLSSVTLTNAAESAANTETIVCTLTGITTPFPNLTAHLRGWAKITCAGSLTAGVLRIRKGTLTGTLVSEQTTEASQFVASKTCESNVDADDALGDVAGQTYVLTFQGTAGASAATFLAGRLECTVS